MGAIADHLMRTPGHASTTMRRGGEQARRHPVAKLIQGRDEARGGEQ
jgi:hypothetical protein